MDREKALALLLRYNKEKFHIQHALTVEEVMKWFANDLGYDINYWGIIGLLHDLDFEMYPNEHCIKAAEILRTEKYTTAKMRPFLISKGWGNLFLLGT